ncbi:MAG: hypothetical protein QXO15_08135 [Nitrososphaerota archaeon]
MSGQLWLTKRIDAKLEELKDTYNVHKEGLGNILLLLALSDEDLVKQAVNIIKIWNIMGTCLLSTVSGALLIRGF